MLEVSEVSERVEGVVALHLPIRLFKNPFWVGASTEMPLQHRGRYDYLIIWFKVYEGEVWSISTGSAC